MARKKAENSKFVVKSNFKDIFKTRLLQEKLLDLNYEQATLYDELAEYTGLKIGAISGLYTQGDRPPILVNAIKIAEFFNVAVTDIWELVENKDFDSEIEKCLVPDCVHHGYVKGYCIKHHPIYYKKRKEKEQVS